MLSEAGGDEAELLVMGEVVPLLLFVAPHPATKLLTNTIIANPPPIFTLIQPLHVR